MIGNNKSFKIGNIYLRLLIGSSITDGRYETFEASSEQKNAGPGLHLHRNMDEIFYMVAGEIIFTVDRKEQIAKAGDTLIVPRNTPHQWKTLHSKFTKVLFTFSPSRNRIEYFKMLAAMTEQGIPYHDILRTTEDQYDNIAIQAFP